MLWRVARVSRVLLLIVGIVLLVAAPVSLKVVAIASAPSSVPRFALSLDGGALGLWVPPAEDEFFWKAFTAGISWANDAPDVSLRKAMLPTAVRSPYNDLILTIPLWLLAFLCLAWPVTSFVIARRRRGTRGFEVEPSQRTEPQ